MGLFGSIGKLAGKLKGVVGKAAASAIPGGALVSAAVGTVGSKLGGRIGRKVAKGAVLAGAGAAAGAGLGALMAGGAHERKRYRRINPGNTRAMGRAIRRIEAGARIYRKFFTIKHGGIHKAPGVRLKRKGR